MEEDTIFTKSSSPAATNRFIYYPDHLVRVPSPAPGVTVFDILYTLFTEPAFKGLWWRGVAEGFVHPRDATVEDESIGSFISRRMGKDAVNRVASALMHGIYAGDIWKLSAKSLFEAPWRFEAEEGSVSEGVLKTMIEGREMTTRERTFAEMMRAPYPYTPSFKENMKHANVFTLKGGLGQLSDALVEKLRRNPNISFRTNTAVSALQPVPNDASAMTVTIPTAEPSSEPLSVNHTHIISTISPSKLSSILSTTDELRADFSPLAQIPSVSVMTVNLYFHTPNLHPPGFGYLIPLATPITQNPEMALGVVFDTAYAPHHSMADAEFGHHVGPAQDTVSKRGTKITVMLGGHYWDGWPVYPSKDEGIQMARSLVERHLGITEAPVAAAANLQSECIPQYTVGHEARIRRTHEALKRRYKGRLRVAGNWARGVGVNDCLRSAWDLVRELREEGGTGLEAVVEEKKWVRIKRVKKKRVERDDGEKEEK